MPIWKINFCFFAAFSITKMERKATNRHVFLRMVGEVEMSRDWFVRVFIVNLNISKVFAETITQSATRFANVYFLHKVQVIVNENKIEAFAKNGFFRVGEWEIIWYSKYS